MRSWLQAVVWLLVVALTVAGFTADVTSKRGVSTCIQSTGPSARIPAGRVMVVGLSLIHHGIVALYTLGWLFPDSRSRAIVFGVMVVILLGWATVKRTCMVTVLINLMCGIEVDAKFKNIYAHLGLKRYNVDAVVFGGSMLILFIRFFV